MDFFFMDHPFRKGMATTTISASPTLLDHVVPRVTTIVGLACIYYAYNSFPRVSTTALNSRRVIASSIRTAGCLIWPHLLLTLVPPKDRTRAAMVIPLLWNPFVWMIDSYMLYHTSSNNSEFRPASLKFDAGNIAGLSFGLSGLLGSKPDGRYIHLFLYAIVSCLILALPSHNLEEDTLEEQVFESVQKAAIVWCVGLLIAGVVFTRMAKLDEDRLSSSVLAKEA